MPRGYSTAVKEALRQAVYRPRWFVRADFDSGIERWWTGRYEISWDGQLWKAGADHLAFGRVSEQATPGSLGFQITLGAIDPVSVAGHRSEPVFARPLTVWQGFLDDSFAIILEPMIIYEGLMDFVLLERNENAIVATVNAEHREILMGRSAGPLRAHLEHLADHPGDLFFSHLMRLVNVPLISPGPGFEPSKL